ncbi:NHS-like protein 3 isoform X2 [Ambystoma mexicanum]|uniref:NHS-like protein 3 isoform X2 n=1 Tax=Ambystoma mexicanum TaxID=8296 RepID=UPI0037E8D531
MGNAQRKRRSPEPWGGFWFFGRRKPAAIKTEEDKRHAAQHKSGDRQQENVFFPSTRPPDLEELHNQAAEGLKSKQNQEKHKHHKNGKDDMDTNSIMSSPVLLVPADEDDVGFRSRSLSCATEHTSEDTLSIRSEMIQRTGSTFRPHDAAKKPSERTGKRRKERRTTVVGVPQHIQKELGIHNSRVVRRGTLDVFDARQPSREEGSPQQSHVQNGGEQGQEVVFIPTVDGSMEPLSPAEGGVRVSLHVLEGGRTRNEIEADEAFQIHMHKVYYDDTNLGKKTSVKMSPFLRPKSLAVPGMTTHGGQNELMGPVMSISPQGTYMSKIIPNAILPPMVDVIALTKNKVRTLSRCSLATASPASVRSSLRHYRSRQNSSSSENWSHSQSTETIVSNTSTISSRGGSTNTLPNDKEELGRECDSHTPLGEVKSPRPSEDQLSLSSSIGSRMNGSAIAHSPNFLTVVHPSGRVSPAYSIGSAADASDTMSIASDRSSVRNVSLRKSKKAPAPPRRTYSLQQQKEMGLPPKPERRPPSKAVGSIAAKDPWVRRTGSRSPGGEDEVFNPSLQGEAVAVWSESPAYSVDAASPAIAQIPGSPASSSPSPGKREILTELQPSTSDVPGTKPRSPDRFERTTSPSSGYSSQSGTPTLSTKGLLDYSSSPHLRRPQPIKLERVETVPTNDISISSSLTSLSSSTSDSSRQQAAMPTTSGSVSEELAIPPHPKVPAPLFPPPSKPKTLLPTPLVAASAPQEPTLSRATDSVSGFTKTGNSPPPSPPPSYHPPPPPARKSESDSEISPSAPAKDSSWPPPPPPDHDEHDLSMADFPPPEEEYFDAPPPSSNPRLGAVPPEVNPSPVVSLASAEPTPTRIPAPAAHSFSARVSSRIQQQGGTHLPQHPSPAGDSPQLKSHVAPVTPLLISGASLLEKSTVFINAARAGSAAPPTTDPVAVVDAPIPKTAPAATPPPPSPAPPPAPRAPALNAMPLNFRPTQSLKKAGTPAGTETKKNIARSKSIQITKEDASLPIVTPSLLQMVRLRSVQAGRHPPAEPKNPPQQQNEPPVGTPAPQKPIRKSLCLRSPPANIDTVPCNPLHQAVQLKASTLSSNESPESQFEKPAGNPANTTLAVPINTALASESSEAKDGQASPHRKSPANTASFIFAKSPKKVVIDPVTSPEGQAGLQKNLVAELMSYSAPRNPDSVQQSQLVNGKPMLQRKPSKIPPPVARKPSQSTPRSPTSPQPWAPPRSPLGPQPWAQPRSPTRVQAPGGDSAASGPQDIKATCAPKAETQTHTVSSEPKDPASEVGRAVQLAGQDPQPGTPAAQEEAGSSAP